MLLSSLITLSLLWVVILAPGPYAGLKIGRFPKIFDYNHYLRHFKKSYKSSGDSYRNKLFLGRSLGIFKHNILFLQRKSNYYLSQSAMMDLTVDEIRERQGQNPDLDLKPVLEAEELGDLPANYLRSIQKLTDDIMQDDEQSVDFIGLDGPEGLKKSLNEAKDDYMSPESFKKQASSGVNLQKYLDNMQEDYMTPENFDKKPINGSGKSRDPLKDPKKSKARTDKSVKADHDDSIDQIMSSFSDSVSNLLDDSMDDVISSFSESVKNLLEEAEEGDDKFTSNVSDVMNPRTSLGPVKYKIDWRITGCIGRPKAQEACNACYIFATLDLLEYFHCRQTKTKASFSSQHVLDCGRESGLINGCQGGKMSEVGRFIRSHGLRLESDYPYTGEHGECKSSQMGGKAITTEIINWQLFNSITAWYTWARKSPILVGINMPADFDVYGGGIHDGQNCNINETHAMLLVGSGTQNGIEFWLLKNSFSEEWGEKGYFRLSKSALLNCFGSAIVARATFQPIK